MTMTTSSWTCPEGHEVASDYCPWDGAKRPAEPAPGALPMPAFEQIAPNAWQKSEPTWRAEPSGWHASDPKKRHHVPIIAAAVAAVVLLGGGIAAVAWALSGGAASAYQGGT
jgi:hypothetical protein